MRLIPWTKTAPRMGGFFDDFTDFTNFFKGDAPSTDWMPAIDLKETENDVVVRAEIPGIDAKEVDVSVVGDVLYLRGEKREEKEEDDRGWHRVERRYGSFSRAIPLPCHVDPEKAKATADKGVLTVHLGKRAEDTTRKINVEVS